MIMMMVHMTIMIMTVKRDVDNSNKDTGNKTNDNDDSMIKSPLIQLQMMLKTIMAMMIIMIAHRNNTKQRNRKKKG